MTATLTHGEQLHDVPRPVWDDFVSTLIRRTGGGRA